MRAKIAKAVREVFASKLRHEIPQFVLVETRRTRPGDCLFSWRMNPHANAYIYLFISPKYNQDKFAIELACATGEFPMQMPREPRSQANGAVRFRLPQLYKDQWPKANWEPMWEVGPHDSPREAIVRAITHIKAGQVPGRREEELLPIEQAIKYVEPQVQDAIDKIKKFGIPFFIKFAEQNSGKT
jgi:hypothetical protein